VRFTKQTRIEATPEAVFAFHEAPGALARLTPPGETIEILEGGGSLQPGSRVVLRARFGPFWLRWVAVHTEYDPPHLFADRQETGPFARWYHRHRFLDDGQGGTLLRDEIDYEPPLGLLGRALAGRFLARKLDRMFAHRHRVTRDALEGRGPDAPG
jgi:ligand-binding SRPBCC domain-containing protein